MSGTSDVTMQPTLMSVASKDEQELIQNYNNLNDEGKEKVLDYVSDLADTGKYKKHSQSELGKQA